MFSDPSPLLLHLALRKSKLPSLFSPHALKSRAFAYNAGRDACDLHSNRTGSAVTLQICVSLSSPLSLTLSLSFSHLLILCSSHSPRSLVLRPPPLRDVPFFLFFLSFFFFISPSLTGPRKKDGRTQNEEWLNCTKLQVHEGILIITFAQAFRELLFILSREAQIRWIVNQYH